jgi:hypothetical protein
MGYRKVLRNFAKKSIFLRLSFSICILAGMNRKSIQADWAVVKVFGDIFGTSLIRPSNLWQFLALNIICTSIFLLTVDAG